ncbi:hypothetical protein HZA43_03595 [Candidatus Peregrinibacteria bacterium]|nr:hypothetical protein [Candidatus Peregrinibacteria bacterium]
MKIKWFPRLLAVVGAFLLLPLLSNAAPAPVSTDSLRVLSDPFEAFLEKVSALTSVGQARALLPQILKNCKELELNDMKGCPDEYKAIKSALNEATRASRGDTEGALDNFKEKASEDLESMSSQFQALYGGDENEEVAEPDLPSDQYNVTRYPERKERALFNPIEEILDWVNWLKEGAFKTRVIRSDRRVGIPMIMNLINSYCEKLEVRGPDDVPTQRSVRARATFACEEVKELQKAASLNSRLKKGRTEIFSILNSEIGYLNDRFEDMYGGSDRPLDQEPPAPVTMTGNPVTQMLEGLGRWDSWRLLPGAIRTRYAPQMIADIKKTCETMVCNSTTRAHCADLVSRSPLKIRDNVSLWRVLDTKNKESKATMISAFQSELEWLEDKVCSGGASGEDTENADENTSEEESTPDEEAPSSFYLPKQ